MKKLLSMFLVMLMLFSNHTLWNKGRETNDSKIASDVLDALESLNHDDELDVYVIISDINHEVVKDKFKTEYPIESYEYFLAKDSDTEAEIRQIVIGNIDEKEDYLENPDPINGVLLQNAIEIKRGLYAEEYLDFNCKYANRLATKEKQLFVSGYSPMLILRLSKDKIINLEKDDIVQRIELFVDYEGKDELSLANSITRSDYVRDVYCNTGIGVKIGQIEAGVPQTGVADLQNASITRHTSPQTTHATKVAQVILGASNGIAPDASLYCTGYSGMTNFYTNIEWLVSQGVNVINMSSGLNNNGLYDVPSQWVDHIAAQHDVHFVKSSGESGGLISSPGMAYNVITVGGYDDKNTLSHSDDSMYSLSAYTEGASTNLAEKPNLIMPAVNVYIDGNVSGTSIAAPQVTGIIAQLCSYRSALKTKQSVMGAMLAAGSYLKIDGVLGKGIRGDDYSQTYLTNTTQLSYREGAGMLDARAARSIALSGNYWRASIGASDFPYTQTAYISSTSNSLIRVAIFWIKRNSISTTSHIPGTLNQIAFTDLDLNVYAPDGSMVGYSLSYCANFEIVQFVPTQSGYYQIKISKGGPGSSTEYVGIAIW